MDVLDDNGHVQWSVAMLACVDPVVSVCVCSYVVVSLSVKSRAVRSWRCAQPD
jgi:hypothetical protein